jgi:cell division protein ZapA (FtsZ GTPase activity inhibitor)
MPKNIKVKIPIFKTICEIDCLAEEEQSIIEVASLVNKEIAQLSRQSNITDEKTLMLLYSIIIRRELERDNDISLQELEDSISNITNHVKKIINKISHL